MGVNKYFWTPHRFAARKDFWCVCALDRLRRSSAQTRVAPCYVDVNMLSYRYGQISPQTHNGSLRTARPRSYRRYQELVWVSLRRGGYQAGLADGSKAGDSPHRRPRQATTLSSRLLERGGSSRA